MTALFGTQYFGFIASAFGITFLVMSALIVWVFVTYRNHTNTLNRLEQAGFKRSSDDE